MITNADVHLFKQRHGEWGARITAGPYTYTARNRRAPEDALAGAWRGLERKINASDQSG